MNNGKLTRLQACHTVEKFGIRLIYWKVRYRTIDFQDGAFVYGKHIQRVLNVFITT